MKCDVCGYDLTRAGTCERTVKYNKKTGAFCRGRTCHTGCAHNHFDSHFNLHNPKSLASQSRSRP